MFIKFIKETIINAGIDKNEVLFYEYLSGEEMINNIDKQQNCDLLILDIQMKKLNGYETAIYFRNIFPKATLVFCSGVYKPTDESFKSTPFRYLLKNYSNVKMLSEIKEIVKEIKFKQKEPLIIGKYYYSIVRLKPDDILYIENSRYGSIIHIQENSIDCSFKGNITTNKKLKEIFNILCIYGFEFAHNSYIVNLRYIIKMQSDGEIILTNGTVLHISRSKLKNFRNAFSEWTSKKYNGLC